jgi:hypothetical protein
MTAEITRQGPGSILYEHAIDRYCIEECEIVDNRRRIMTYWKSHTCSICKDIYPRYSICRHIGRIVDLDLNNRGGFLVSLPTKVLSAPLACLLTPPLGTRSLYFPMTPPCTGPASS